MQIPNTFFDLMSLAEQLAEADADKGVRHIRAFQHHLSASKHGRSSKTVKMFNDQYIVAWNNRKMLNELKKCL